LREAVRLARDHGYADPDCLAAAALVAAQSGDAERAAMLLGAVERLMSLRTYSDRSPVSDEAMSRARAAAAYAVDERALSAAEAAGKELSLSAAVELAARALESASAGSGGGR
jgi:hypothetical protein